jgi:site-specific DNA recombinase
MRFSIWSAVSTQQQATPDRVSLQQQEENARRAALAHNWQETSGPYIVPGASRSFYVNLNDAENDIPQLKQMLEDARNNLFDVLVIYSYDRLGDLADMVANSLRFYGKQLYSVSQPAEPQDPDHFDPYTSENESIMRDVHRITQNFRINDLRRKYKVGMPARIARGLTPLRVPFGYRWIGKKQPPELEPQKAALIIQCKNLFLQGRSLTSITQHADQSGILPPNGGEHWDLSTIKYILTNPYYAGLVTLNKSQQVRDLRRKNQKRQVELPHAKWTVGKGTHKALWDEATHRSLVREMERRYTTNRHFAARFPLSGLLVCSVCGRKLHRRSHGHAEYQRRKVLSCEAGPAHVIIPYPEGVDLVARHLAEQLQKYKAQPLEDKQEDSQRHYQSAMEDIQKRRKRVQEGFEGGVYTPLEAKAKLTELENQLETLRLELEKGENAAQLRAEITDQFPDLTHFHEWVQEDDPVVVHRLLTALCEKITVSPEHTVTIHWRT